MVMVQLESHCLDIERAAQKLRLGELVAFPTETVYGLGADALNIRALDTLYRLKGRPKRHPVIVHLASAEFIEIWVETVSPQALLLAERFWPGPLTMILPKSCHVLDQVTGGHPGVGIRVPRHPVAQQFLKHFGGGIAAPSANRYGQLSPTQASHVRDAFGYECPWLLEGGPSQVGLESTIIDLTIPDKPSLLRAGHITADMLSEALGQPVLTGGMTPAPGNLPAHYAPRTPLQLVERQHLVAACIQATEAKQRVVLISCQFDLPIDVIAHLHMPLHPEPYNRRLYATLHEADNLNADVILVESLARLALPGNEWAAAWDRLQRAAVSWQSSSHLLELVSS